MTTAEDPRISAAQGGPTQPPERLPRTVLIGLGVLGVLVTASALLAASVGTNTGVATLDAPTLQAILAARTPGLAAGFTSFTNLGKTLPMVIMGLALTTWLFLRFRRVSIWVLMLVAPIVSVSLTELGKAFFARPRPPFTDAVPPLESSFSFPSGHALNSTVVAGTLAYLTVWLARRAWVRVVAILAAATWAITIGFSRIYLGHHWLTDVVFGWLAGLSWLATLILAHQFWLATRPTTRST